MATSLEHSCGFAQPLEHGGFYIGKLREVKRTELTNRSRGWVGGNALRDECVIFKKRNWNFDFKLRAAKGGAVENDREDGTVGIGERNAEG